MQQPKHYWFPAKRYGWGWGLPSAWQGWLVLAIYAVAIVAVCLLFPPKSGSLRFILLVAGSTVALIVICWFTGEPPHWSWGDKR